MYNGTIKDAINAHFEKKRKGIIKSTFVDRWRVSYLSKLKPCSCSWCYLTINACAVPAVTSYRLRINNPESKFLVFIQMLSKWKNCNQPWNDAAFKFSQPRNPDWQVNLDRFSWMFGYDWYDVSVKRFWAAAPGNTSVFTQWQLSNQSKTSRCNRAVRGIKIRNSTAPAAGMGVVGVSAGRPGGTWFTP